MNDLIDLYAQNDISLLGSVINLLASLLLGIILSLHFLKFSSTLSGKRELSRVIPFLVLIVCLIITIVKSSLALSLGLVGALSIVRFRTPIKEPEELAYLFMAIAIGLGFGANQGVLTTVASLVILVAVALLRWKFYAQESSALYLVVEMDNADQAGRDPVREVTETVSTHAQRCDLKRIDRHDSGFQVAYMIGVTSTDDAFKLVESLNKEFPSSNISIIDQSRIPGV